MRFGVRSKLFAVSFALIVSVGLATGLYLQGELRARLEHRIEMELSRQAYGAREMLQEYPRAFDVATADVFAERLAPAFDSRVTLINADGRVLGESNRDLEDVENMENHGNRPEVRDALAVGHGESRRYSTTLGTYMLYVAVAYEHQGNRGVVRVARPLSEVDAAVAQLRAALLVAGILGLVVAVFMSLLASYLVSRTLLQLSRSAQAIANRDAATSPDKQIALDTVRSDELGRLAGSIKHMAREIETTIATLASERARFKAVLEGMRESIIAIDDRRRIELMNDAARELLGLDETPEQQLLFAHLRTPAVDELLAAPIESRSVEFDLPSNRARRMLAHVTPERGGSGCIIVIRDVTDIRRLTTMRRDFVANVSHELRTPVSVIQANAETLLAGASGDPVHGPRLLEALHRNAMRLSSIISDLLVLSRIESGHQPLDRQRVDVTLTAEQAAQAVETKAAERDITLTIDVPPGVEVFADRSALDHILVNYLDNAVKYTQTGGHVRVSASQHGERLRIDVQDDGPGIPQHLQGRVFERFFRVDAGRSRSMGGTGLGLAIVKHLASAMDGEVGVQFVSPQGSRFYVSLPVPTG